MWISRGKWAEVLKKEVLKKIESSEVVLGPFVSASSSR
jgi:hypothetical protein